MTAQADHPLPCRRAVICTTGKESAGFTLFELLVSLIIIGIVLGLAVLSLPPDTGQRRLQIEAERLTALLKLAREEAILSTSLKGFWIQKNHYAFQRYHDGAWLPMDDSDVFRERELPEEISLELETEIVPDILSDSGATKIPNVIFWPSGEINAFTITFRGGEGDILVVEGTTTGDLALTRHPPD